MRPPSTGLAAAGEVTTREPFALYGPPWSSCLLAFLVPENARVHHATPAGLLAENYNPPSLPPSLLATKPVSWSIVRGLAVDYEACIFSPFDSLNLISSRSKSTASIPKRQDAATPGFMNAVAVARGTGYGVRVGGSLRRRLSEQG